MGLLMGALAGGIKGAGDAMIDQAKANREAVIAALAEQNKRTDQQAEFAQQTKTVGTQEAAETQRSTDANTNALTMNTANNTQSGLNNAANNTQSGLNNAATNKQAGSDNAATTGTEMSVAKLRANSYDNKTAQIAAQYGNGKPLTYNQALTTARQAYKDNASAFTEGDGTPTPPDKAISDIASKLMNGDPGSRPTPITGTALAQPSGLSPSFGASGLNPQGGGLTSNIFGSTAPAPVAGAPAVTPPPPPAIAKIPGLQYSPSQKLYRDPATNKTYDASGNASANAPPPPAVTPPSPRRRAP